MRLLWGLVGWYQLSKWITVTVHRFQNGHQLLHSNLRRWGHVRWSTGLLASIVSDHNFSSYRRSRNDFTYCLTGTWRTVCKQANGDVRHSSSCPGGVEENQLVSLIQYDFLCVLTHWICILHPQQCHCWINNMLLIKRVNISKWHWEQATISFMCLHVFNVFTGLHLYLLCNLCIGVFLTPKL